jgi:hypothetical protein
MSVASTITRSRPERLIRAVARLTPTELSEFVLRFDDLQSARQGPLDRQAATIADIQRLPANDRARVAELLTRNRETGLSAQEEGELDSYMSEMDRRLSKTTDELLTLAQRRQHASRKRSQV